MVIPTDPRYNARLSLAGRLYREGVAEQTTIKLVAAFDRDFCAHPAGETAVAELVRKVYA